MNRHSIRIAIAVTVLGFAAQQAHAVPILQLYVEGGAYDDTSETWVLTPPGSSAGVPFRLWTIGNVAGPGSKGPISDVKLSIAFDEAFSDLQVSLTPSRVGGLGVGSYGGFTDPLPLPTLPVLNTSVNTSLGMVHTGPDGVVDNGGTPVLGDGSNLPSHGVFGEGTAWIEYLLGDFDGTDSPVGDFIDSFPDILVDDSAQINVYEVSVLNGHGATVHFDLYDSVAAGNHLKAKFAPFSHDADAEANIIPEPASVVVWLLLATVGVVAGRHFRRRSAR